MVMERNVGEGEKIERREEREEPSPRCPVCHPPPPPAHVPLVPTTRHTTSPLVWAGGGGTSATHTPHHTAPCLLAGHRGPGEDKGRVQ